VGVCKQITIHIFHQAISRLVAPLKLIFSSIQVSDVLVLTLRCKLFKSVFRMFPLFIWLQVLHCSGYSHLFHLDPVTTAI
jgi:ABC-type amino acid transport system permease subunit